MALAIDWDPPTGSGQPPAWASAPNNIAVPLVASPGSDPMQWALTPVTMAGAMSPLNRAFHQGPPCSRVLAA